MKLHRQLNHQSNGSLQRLLRHARATHDAVRDAGSCALFAEMPYAEVTKVPADFAFNAEVVLDAFHAFDAEQKRCFFLNVVDAGSRYQAITSRRRDLGPMSTTSCSRGCSGPGLWTTSGSTQVTSSAETSYHDVRSMECALRPPPWNLCGRWAWRRSTQAFGRRPSGARRVGQPRGRTRASGGYHADRDPSVSQKFARS